MCAVSGILNWGAQFPDEYWDRDRLNSLVDMVNMAKVFDKNNGNVDCTDPEKALLLDKIEYMLSKIDQ